MKKGLRLFILSALIILLFLVDHAAPAFAAPARVSTSATHLSRFSGMRRQSFTVGRASRGEPERDKQAYQGFSSDGNTSRFIGHNQNNTGNPGHNHGVNMDDSGNAGNQIMSRHGIRRRRGVNQFYHGSSSSNRRNFSWGYNLDNTGNPGYNYGFNQDNSGNAGNQVIN